MVNGMKQLLEDLQSNVFEVLNEELPSSFRFPIKRKLIGEFSIMKGLIGEYAKKCSPNK